MKKILFTIQWYPSVLSANALCDKKIIDQLKLQDDYAITCLAYRSNKQSQYEELDGVRIFRFKRSFWWNILVDAKLVNRRKSKIIIFIDRLFLKLKQIITIPVYPFVDINSCIKFTWKAIRLHRVEKFDIVVSEHHGIDSLIAGYFLKRLYPKLKFVAILWDPISAKEPPRYLPHSYARNRLIKLESAIIGVADQLIGMKSSENTVRNYIKDCFSRHCFFDIPGIIKQSQTKDVKENILKDGCINVVFSGILMLPDRNPEYIIEAINRLPFSNMFNVIFFCTGAGRFKLCAMKDAFKGRILIHDYVSYDELLTIYSRCDVLLNFGGRNPNMVPSKIFEYMSFGKPIISMYSIDNESSMIYLNSYPLAICIDERQSMDLAVRQLEEFFKNSLSKTVPFEKVEELYPLNSPNIYVKLLTSL